MRRCSTIRCRAQLRWAGANSPPSWGRRSRRVTRIPVLLDGFVCVAAVAPLVKLRADALEHAMAAHVSAEATHRMLLRELHLDPLLDLGMRLGEGSGATLAVSVLRAALACHAGMATFNEAGVANNPS